MTEITEFIRDRLDDWAQAACDAGEAEWRRDGINSVHDADDWPVIHGDGSWPDGSQADHIALNSPARVLAQVAAMRAIVDLLTSRERQDDSEEGLWHKVGYDRAAFDVLRHLAAIWRDHDDYDPAWAPEGE